MKNSITDDFINKFIDFGEGYFGSLYTDKYQKARIRHTCTICRNTIGPSDQYRYISGKWGRNFHTYKFCLDCDDSYMELCSLELDSDWRKDILFCQNPYISNISVYSSQV